MFIMGKIYKRKCNRCGKYYEGQGKIYCSKSCALKGNKWNKGKKFSYKRKQKLKKITNNGRFKKGHKGIKSRLGIRLSKNIKDKISKSLIGRFVGKNSPSWIDGRTPKNVIIRSSKEYKLWRKAIFEKDNFICQKCNQLGGNLIAHHINNFADFPELRFAINNGITFCKECHKKFHKKYGNKNNTKEQLGEFINV